MPLYRICIHVRTDCFWFGVAMSAAEGGLDPILLGSNSVTVSPVLQDPKFFLGRRRCINRIHPQQHFRRH